MNRYKHKPCHIILKRHQFPLTFTSESRQLFNINHSTATIFKTKCSLTEVNGNKLIKVHSFLLNNLLPYKTIKSLVIKVLLYSEEILRKSREKKPKQHIKFWAICQNSLSVISPSLPFKLAVIYQTIQKTKERRKITFQRYFSPVYISFFSLPYPSSLFRHFPTKQRFKKHTQKTVILITSSFDCAFHNRVPGGVRWP